MRLTVEIDSNIDQVECAADSLLSHVIAGINVQLPDYGAIIICNGNEWRLSKKDLDSFAVKTIGALDGDILKLEKVNYNESTFELPSLGNKMQNLIRSITVKSNPIEQMAESMIANDAQGLHNKFRNDKSFLSRYTWVAPSLVRYFITHPDDFGGFLLVFKKWRVEQGIKTKELDERMRSAIQHTPEVFTPPSTLYIRGLMNGHEVTAMIDTGAQCTVMHESLARKIGIIQYVDERAGVGSVVGVGGKTRPLGKIFSIDYQLTAGVISVSAIILPSDGTMSDHFILGLDVMLCHGCTIDLTSRRLTFSGHHEPLLSVEECDRIDKAKHGKL